MKITRTMVLKVIREHGGVLRFRELMQMFSVSKANRLRFKETMDAMAAAGDVAKLKGNAYAIPAGTALLSGRLSTHRDGYGFVAPDAGGEDIFIPARFLRGTMHGDEVEVNVVSTGGEGKREGRIARVINRARTKVTGRFQLAGKTGRLIPDDPRLGLEILIPLKSFGGARDGEMAVAQITSYPTERRGAEGRIIEVLGRPDDPEVEVRTIISKYELPTEFSAETLKSAGTVSPSVQPADRKGRVDLTGRLTVTIDGETARDFDDAVSVAREPHGVIRLWVSIADVSHYVRPDSPLDREAYMRGTSVYFPDRCLPMLPEELSNGICSLNPGVERLTVTAELEFDLTGALKNAAFYPSFIRSAARLTYTTVRKVLVDHDQEATAANAHLLDDLKLMEELALRLMERRRQRGSIDFDLPEPEIVLDLQGGTVAIVRSERNLAHRIIEEFMLAANEAVAKHLEDRHLPSLYRIHEPPDILKLRDFSEFIHNFGYDFSVEDEKVSPDALQRLLQEAAGKPEERMINEVLLRSMKQARYSAENVGHFGLAALCYTHFTSPIRRYPDLVVHRILKGVLSGKLKEQDRERLDATLPDVAAHSSSRERVAVEAEREIITLKKVQFMRSKVGEEYDGFITGVTTYGIFVELVELFVEGMVHVSMLPNDFYLHQEKQHSLVGERTRRTFRIGDKVRVIVANVSIERRQIDFAMAESAEASDWELSGVTEDRAFPRIPVKGKRPAGAKKEVHRPSPKGPKKGKGKGGPRRRR